jgi:hypothetical protein
MSRIHWWSFLVNEEGQPINNADISIYLAGTTVPAKIFLDEFSTESEDSIPQLKSSKNGYFEFWIPDVTSDIYTSGQKFKIEWDKAGLEYGYIDFVDIYPSYYPVDENKSDTKKDKTVSNELAQRWESHALDDSHVIHGIEEITFEDLNTIRNRTISNKDGFEWEKHTNSIFTTEGTSGQTFITGTHATSADFPHDIHPWNPSENIELTDSNYWIKNRLISHHYGTKWNNHVENGELHHNSYHESISSTDWSPSGANYIFDVIHQLNEPYPMIQMWNTDTKLQQDPVSIKSLSSSGSRIENDSEINAKVIILK